MDKIDPLKPGKYLGEFPVDIKDTPYKDYTPIDWAMRFLECYGQIDGDHHKTWVLDQMARCVKGTPVVVVLAKWESGYQEYRWWTGEPSEEYKKWVLEMKGDYDEENEEYEYSYDEGIPP